MTDVQTQETLPVASNIEVFFYVTDKIALMEPLEASPLEKVGTWKQ